MTELECVNQILATIGEQPVSSLTGDKTQDCSLALSTLREVNRDKQKRGWNFNTEHEYILSRDGDNKIPVPSNTIKLEVPTGRFCNTDPVQRGSFLYDRKNQTFVFTTTVTLSKIVFELDFEDTSTAFQSYVAVRASRLFAERWLVGSDVQSTPSTTEVQAWADLLREEIDSEQLNMAMSDPTLTIIRRRPR